MERKSIFILGGARSGKSHFAQELAQTMSKKVLFVATAEPLDKEMKERIEEHKKNRPTHWQTLEIPANLGREIKEHIKDAEVVIVDCLSLLLSNLLTRQGNNDYPDLEQRVEGEIKGLIQCMEESKANFIIVSNEVGMGLVPDYPLGRIYRDLLGRINQLLARYTDEVYLMVAGIPLKLKG